MLRGSCTGPLRQRQLRSRPPLRPGPCGAGGYSQPGRATQPAVRGDSWRCRGSAVRGHSRRCGGTQVAVPVSAGAAGEHSRGGAGKDRAGRGRKDGRPCGVQRAVRGPRAVTRPLRAPLSARAAAAAHWPGGRSNGAAGRGGAGRGCLRCAGGTAGLSLKIFSASPNPSAKASLKKHDILRKHNSAFQFCAPPAPAFPLP